MVEELLIFYLSNISNTDRDKSFFDPTWAVPRITLVMFFNIKGSFPSLRFLSIKQHII